MIHEEFDALCKKCEQMLRDAAPCKTGNLRYNAIKMEIIGNVCRLYVDEEIAPDMKYTNEPWTNGKKNPNEGWFDKVAEKIMRHVAERMGGEIHNA